MFIIAGSDDPKMPEFVLEQLDNVARLVKEEAEGRRIDALLHWYAIGITPPQAEELTWGSGTFRTLREVREGCFVIIEYMTSGKRRA